MTLGHIYNLDENEPELTTAAKTLGIIVVDNDKVQRDEPDQLDKWWGIPNPYDGPGIWVWVEYKTEDGALRPGQARKIAEVQDAGLPVELVRNTADIERIYFKYLDIMNRQ